MNKYASGYTLIAAVSVLGWLVIAFSIIAGIVAGSNAPPGSGGIGWIVAIVGSMQGLMLLGFGAIGGAVLDGSSAQQLSIEKLDQIIFNTMKEKNSEVVIKVKDEVVRGASSSFDLIAQEQKALDVMRGAKKPF